MRNKLFAVLLTFLMIFAVSPIAYAVPENPQAFANGFSTVINISAAFVCSICLRNVYQPQQKVIKLKIIKIDNPTEISVGFFHYIIFYYYFIILSSQQTFGSGWFQKQIQGIEN